MISEKLASLIVLAIVYLIVFLGIIKIENEDFKGYFAFIEFFLTLALICAATRIIAN